MSQSLKRVYVTYSQFENLIFEFLSKMKKESFENEIIFKIEITFVMLFIIGDYSDAGFCLFINDYMNIITNFDVIFEFLHTKYFFKTTFELVYLSKHKIYIFINNLKMMRFIEGV